MERERSSSPASAAAPVVLFAGGALYQPLAPPNQALEPTQPIPPGWSAQFERWASLGLILSL